MSNKQWHGGKGDAVRPKIIKMKEEDLRWELAFGKVSPERKQEILDELEKMKNKK